MLKERMTEQKAIRDQTRADAEPVGGAGSAGTGHHTPGAENLREPARERMRTKSRCYLRDPVFPG
jgi:hypothetical protein